MELWAKISTVEQQSEAVRRSRVTYQNLNSGSLLMKGLNSSDCLVGKLGPSSKDIKQIYLWNRYIYETDISMKHI